MAKDNRKLKVFMGVFIILLMVVSTLGVIFYGYAGNTASTDYNGFGFTPKNQQWESKIEGKKYLFSYHPSQLDALNMSADMINAVKNSKAVAISYNPKSASKNELATAQYELSTLLPKPIINSFTENIGTQVPTYTCSNATSDIVVVIFEESNVNDISMDSNCIKFKAIQPFDFLAYGDRLAYGVLGVIK